MTEQENDGKVEHTPSGKLVVHGRASSYNNHKCRCTDCKAAWAMYMYPRLKKHREKKRLAKKTKVQINL
jgi:hypothetical protein